MCSTHFASNHSNAQDHISTEDFPRIFPKKSLEMVPYFPGGFPPRLMTRRLPQIKANCDARRLHGVQSGQLLLPPRQCIGLERPNLWYIMTMYDRYHMYIYMICILYMICTLISYIIPYIYNVLYNDRWW